MLFYYCFAALIFESSHPGNPLAGLDVLHYDRVRDEGAQISGYKGAFEELGGSYSLDMLVSR